MLNAALVGLGHWGRKIVAAVEGEDAAMRISHVVVRAARADIVEFARAHAMVVATDFQRMLRDSAIDAVIITTPHSLHADLIVAAALAGKHVFCEKPLTLTRVDALRAVRACADARRVLAVGHDKRFWGSMSALREIAAAGTLGDILHVEGHSSNENSNGFTAEWRRQPAETPGAGMTGTGIHMLDALIGIAGPLAATTAQVLTRLDSVEPRDTVAALLRFRNGISGTLATVRTTPFYWRAHVFGDAGSAEALGPATLILRTAGGALERREFPIIDTIRAEMDAFAAAIDGTAPFPVSPAEMTATVTAFEGILKSIQSGRTVTVE